MATLPVVIPTSLTHKDLRGIKIYLGGELGKFCTPSVWKSQGFAPVTGATLVDYTTAQGFQFQLVHESQVEVFDAEAEKRRRDAIKELQTKRDKALKRWTNREVSDKDYRAEDANLVAEIADLMKA